MKSKEKEILIFAISVLFFLIYILGIFLVVYPKYLNNQGNDDPLAMVNSSFPFLSVISLIFSSLIFFSFYSKVRNKFLQLFLLIQLSLILWGTPSYLSGYVSNPDTLYHLGTSLKINKILEGENIVFSDYGKSYPISFILNYLLLKLIDFDISFYAKFFFPSLWIILFISLSYILVSKIFSAEIAFLSTFLLVLGLNFVESHPSPHAFGVILLLTSLILLCYKNTSAKILSILTIITSIITHPESPLLLIVFLIANLFFSSSLRKPRVLHFSFSGILMVYVAWISWALFQSSIAEKPILDSFLRIISLNFLTNFEKTSSTSYFIFPEFSQLRMLIILSYSIFASIFLLNNLEFKEILKGNLREASKKTVGNLGENRVLFLILTFFFLVIMFIFGLFSDLVIRQRAFIYLILTISGFIAGSFVYDSSKNKNKKMKLFLMNFLIILWISSLAFLYPVASYYTYTFSSIPLSEIKGLEFLSNVVDGKYLFDYRSVSVLPFIDDKVNFTFLYLPLFKNELPKTSEILKVTDVAIFRKSLYYELSMQFDLSFEDNVYTRIYDAITSSKNFNKLYSNKRTEIFVKTY